MNYDIYYFTGTGNSLKIAKDIAKKLKIEKVNRIKNESKFPKEDGIATNSIGIVFPVYAFGIPDIVKRFLENLKNIKKAFVIVSHGGMPGVALHQAKEILERQKIEITGLYSIKMPDNYIIMSERDKDEKINYLIRYQEQVLFSIADKITSGEKHFDKIKSFKPLSLINTLALKKFKKISRGFHHDSKCSECGICQKICPVENIYLEDGKPKWKEKCELCMGCIQWCPEESIQYKRKTINKKRYKNPKINLEELLS